ncbi:MAG: alpha/beta fold hydrolase [Burkholderiaceae bacterium]
MAQILIDSELPAEWLSAQCTSGVLDVGNSHRIFWRCYGHTKATPVVALHGGPGSGSHSEHLTFFDPQRHRVIMFDQRGSGHSIASVVIESNTTQDLIEDVERLRRHLRIDSWLVFGVSWGACLALLYGQSHPQSCTRLILSGLSNRHAYQTRWILDQRPRLLPERHEAFLSALTPGEKTDPVAAYYRKSLSTDLEEQLVATRAVWVLEAGLEESEPEPIATMRLNEISPSMVKRAKIYLHYWANKTFLPNGHLLVNPQGLTDLPVTLVHGESDWICPLSGAQQVADAIESAQLIVVPGAGHSPYGAPTIQVLRESLVPAV